MSRFLVVFVVVIAALVACVGAPSSSPTSSSPPKPKPKTTTGPLKSNIEFADYAGSQACARCHPAYVERWMRAPMHNMTRTAHGLAEVKGPFDGTTFRLRDDTAKLETAGSDRFMTLSSKRFGGGVYKLTRVIGGRVREDYAGVAVARVAEGAPALSDPSEEHVLPVSYIIGTKQLRYKGYSVMVKERDGLKIGAVWNQTCIFCHNTVPYLSTVFGALGNTSGYQGEVVDPLLPASMRAQYVVANDRAMTKALETEITRLGGSMDSKKPTMKDAMSVTRSRFRVNHLVEVGIGCESCHLGSAHHARSSEPAATLPSFEPVSEAMAVRLPSLPRSKSVAATKKGHENAAALNRVCARCHQVLFSGYDPTWEGGSRKRSPGGSHINSGEARDMMLGACASRLACVDCHDPHAPDGSNTLRALEPAKQDALCTNCHESLAGADAQRAHTHHDPGKQGGRCLNCHMPKKNMALDGGLSRYHRIASPTDMSKVLLDRPMECALCHIDKEVGDLAGTMERWWKKGTVTYERGALEKLYGALDANVILATAERGKPHEQAVAFQLLGDGKVKAGIPVLARELTNHYPLVRGYAKRAIDSIEGAPVAIDVDAPDEAIRESAGRLLLKTP